MCAAFIGDVNWLNKVCGDDGDSACTLKHFSGEEGGLTEELSTAEVVVLLTDQVSHAVRRRVLFAASSTSVPVLMRHSAGASVTLGELRTQPQDA